MKLICTLFLFTFSVLADNTCSRQGEEWYPLLPGKGYKSCCAGFTATSKHGFTQNLKKCVPSIPGDSGRCVKCGDGKCSTEHFEDKCSCPKDCK